MSHSVTYNPTSSPLFSQIKGNEKLSSANDSTPLAGMLSMLIGGGNFHLTHSFTDSCKAFWRCLGASLKGFFVSRSSYICMFFALIMSLALVSCSNDDFAEENRSEIVDFDAIMGFFYEKSLHLEEIEYENVKSLAISFSQNLQIHPELKQHDLYAQTVQNFEKAGVLIVGNVVFDIRMNENPISLDGSW